MLNDLFTMKLYQVSIMPREAGYQESNPFTSSMNMPTFFIRARSFTEAIERAEQAHPNMQVHGINLVTHQDPSIKDLL
jgi:hypothetical protein